jgi:hypothetical protein
MLLRILEWTAAAALAFAVVPVLASEPACKASVCSDDAWPVLQTAAPAFALDQHVGSEVIEEMVASHIATDDSVTEHEETVHLHRYALLSEVLEQAERP